ncbi:MAG: M16 family metallopeptidase [Pyrinomonadaceae bacterium]
MNEEIRETRLDNGLVILSDRMAGVRSATIEFLFRVGARHEPTELNGITHFIEHCVFKGTAKRNAREIAAEQDRLGGNLDAFTTHEETGFVIKVVDDEFDKAFDLLSDMIGCPRFDEAELASERRVIVEEIKMNEDSPEEVISDIFHREFFPANPLGLTITGTPETVASFNHRLTADFHRQAFSPANLIITAAGNVDHEHLVDLVRNSAFGIEQTDGSALNRKPLTPTIAAPISVEHRPDLEQAHLFMATPIVSARDPRRYAADLLTTILGGSTSSRLWQRVREERGLAYNIGTSTAMFLDCGFMAISAASSPEHVSEIAAIVVDELGSIVHDGVSNVELELMKDQTRASVLLGLEDSAGRAATLAQCEMVHGRHIPVSETLANLDAVTAEDVRLVAGEFFRSERLALVALGDLEDISFTRGELNISG